MGENTKRVVIEDIARTVGVEHIEVVDAYDLKAAQAAFERMIKSPRYCNGNQSPYMCYRGDKKNAPKSPSTMEG
jgi:hypothetical protein